MLAVDDELPALEDLVACSRRRRSTSSSRRPRPRRRWSRSATVRDRRGVPRRADAGARRARAGGGSCGGSSAARHRVRVRVRRRRGRRVRGRRRRLPGQAGLAAGSTRRSSAARGATPERAAPPTTTRRWPVDPLRGGGTRLLPRSPVLYLQAHGDYVRVASSRAATSCARGCRTSRSAGPARLRARPPRLRRQPAARGRGPPALNGTAVLVMADGAEVPIARRQVGELRRKLRGRDRRARRDELAEATAHGGATWPG